MKYYVDVYGYNKTGNPVFLGEATYTVNAATAESAEVTTDNSTGTFKVSVNGISADLGIGKVQVAVWSDNKWQDDLFLMLIKPRGDKLPCLPKDHRDTNPKRDKKASLHRHDNPFSWRSLYQHTLYIPAKSNLYRMLNILKNLPPKAKTNHKNN